MRPVLLMILAVVTVAGVLFFGLSGQSSELDLTLPLAPTTLVPIGTSTGVPTTTSASTTGYTESDSDTLIAVTTIVGMTLDDRPPETLGTLPPVDGLGVPTLDAASSVSTVGIDRVMFGMTIHDAQLAAGSRFTPVTPTGHCFLVVPEAGQAGLTFWVVAGTVERVDVDTRTITTRSGAGIGDTEERVREMFGERIRTTPLPDGSGNLLAYIPKDVQDATYRVMFLSNGLQITRMWAGRLPWAEELGGCPG